MTFPIMWKGIQQNYDDLLATAERSYCFCLSERSAKMILAALQPYHWKTRYFSPTDLEIVLDNIDAWVSKAEEEIVSGLNSGCGCGFPTGVETRVNEDGELEISYDGGETWESGDQYDPRQNSIQFPPLPEELGDNTRCAGAQNAGAQLEAFIDQLADILDAGGALTALVAAITAVAAVFLSGGTLLPLIVGLAAAVVTLTASSLRAAFDEAAIDKFICCIEGNAADDASIDNTAFANIIGCITDDMSGTAQTVTLAICQLLGPDGLTNWMRTGSSDGVDCGCNPCDPECDSSTTPELDFDSLPAGWSVVGCTIFFGGGNGCEATATDDPIIISFPEMCVINISGSIDTGASPHANIEIGDETATDVHGIFAFTPTTPQRVSEIRIWADNGLDLSHVQITYCDPS